jgi:WD40 repeat protein
MSNSSSCSRIRRTIPLSPGGGSIATRQWDRSVEVWDLEARTELFTVDGKRRVIDVERSPDGQLLLKSTADGRALVVDRSGSEIQVLADGAFRMRAARFSPDGTLIATSGAGPLGDSVWVWD